VKELGIALFHSVKRIPPKNWPCDIARHMASPTFARDSLENALNAFLGIANLLPVHA